MLQTHPMVFLCVYVCYGFFLLLFSCFTRSSFLINQIVVGCKQSYNMTNVIDLIFICWYIIFLFLISALFWIEWNEKRGKYWVSRLSKPLLLFFFHFVHCRCCFSNFWVQEQWLISNSSDWTIMTIAHVCCLKSEKIVILNSKKSCKCRYKCTVDCGTAW